MLSLPLRSISFSNGSGIRIAKGMSLRISSATLVGSLSAYGADIKKSIFDDAFPTVLLIGLVGSLQLCTSRVTTAVSFSALTRRFVAFFTESGSSLKSISRSTGRSRLSNLCSCLASLESGSATAMVGPDLYSVSTIDVKSDVSWILHVDNLPLLLREELLIPGKWSE